MKWEVYIRADGIPHHYWLREISAQPLDVFTPQSYSDNVGYIFPSSRNPFKMGDDYDL